MLRVLALIPGFPDVPKAWPPSLLLERLAERVELTVATWSYPDRPQPYALGRIQVVPLRRMRHLSAAAHLASLARPELVHAFWALQPGALGVTLAKVWGVPSVVSALGGEVVSLPQVPFGSTASPWMRTLARVSLRGADAVIAGSQSQLQACWRLAKLQRALVLPVGFHERFTPLPARERDERVRLLAIGALLPVKRVGLILEALARLGARYSLEIAGKGPLEAALVSQARALGVGARVRFLGEIDGPALLEALRCADLVVHASAHEGGSVALLEALATSRPVVSTAVGAAPELLADGAGVLAGANAAGIAIAIERATAALDTVHRPAAERAAKAVHERWVVDAVAATLLNLYEELTCPGAGQRGAGPG